MALRIENKNKILVTFCIQAVPRETIFSPVSGLKLLFSSRIFISTYSFQYFSEKGQADKIKTTKLTRVLGNLFSFLGFYLKMKRAISHFTHAK
jgi:hypothetical protein